MKEGVQEVVETQIQSDRGPVEGGRDAGISSLLYYFDVPELD